MATPLDILNRVKAQVDNYVSQHLGAGSNRQAAASGEGDGDQSTAGEAPPADDGAVAAAGESDKRVFKSIFGAMAALMVNLAHGAEQKVKLAVKEVETRIETAKLRGELVAKLTELEGLLGGTDKAIKDVTPAAKKTRCITLMYEINSLSKRLGYGPGSGDKDNRLFGSGDRTGALGFKDSISSDAAADAAKGSAFDSLGARVALNIQRNLAIPIASPDYFVTSSIGTLARAMSDSPAISKIIGSKWTHVDVLKLLQTPEAWAAFETQFPGAKARIEANGSKADKAALAAFEAALGAEVAKALSDKSNPNLVKTGDGLLETDTGATVKAALSLAQSDSQADNQYTSKAMSDASTALQQQNTLTEMAKSYLSQENQVNNTINTK